MDTIVPQLCLFALIINCSFGYFGQKEEDDTCFCQLQGRIDDCSCNVDAVDSFNNVKIYPRLRSLLNKDYFRFYKVNLKRPCPFWADNSRCSMRYCHVEPCHDEDIPSGLKGEARKTVVFSDAGAEKYKDPSCEQDLNAELSFLNTSISAKVQEDLALWTAHDDAQDNFCVLDDNDSDAEYVDLLLNPERYTGYKGESAHKIWRSIYMENCFKPTQSISPYAPGDWLNLLCLEERVFYRLISGLHSSINIHLSAKYLLSENAGGISLKSPKGEWGPNVGEFKRRFSPESTDGRGQSWLKNLYFLYLVELRALAKVAPYLEQEEFYTGNENEDWDTQQAVKDLLKVISIFPQHFDESTMFKDTERAHLKQEFKQHFRNITRIMDCVGCDKCKLWGKLQTQGLGTALKILFSSRFEQNHHDIFVQEHRRDFQLQRSEIVSLINSIGRLSTSIYELDEFRHNILVT